MNIDFNVSGSVDPSLFIDSHFLAAARTFQDYLFSDWLSDAHAERVPDEKVRGGNTDGSLAALWKDEVWERDNKKPTTHSSPTRAERGFFLYTRRFLKFPAHLSI
jgi:hypothetical protein